VFGPVQRMFNPAVPLNKAAAKAKPARGGKAKRGGRKAKR